MMNAMDVAPPSSEVRRTVTMDFLYLDLSTCGRCRGTGANIATALSAVEHVLHATGARVELRRVHVESAEQARTLRFASSPTIRVNGRDIAPERLASACGADECGCGPDATCRVWRHLGREHDEAPVGMIVDAVLSELYAGTTHADPPAAAYELPDDLLRVFAARDAGAPAGGCCA